MQTRQFIILSVIASMLLGGAGAMWMGMAAPRWTPTSGHPHASASGEPRSQKIKDVLGVQSIPVEVGGRMPGKPCA